jgi:hypothetical protein
VLIAGEGPEEDDPTMTWAPGVGRRRSPSRRHGRERARRGGTPELELGEQREKVRGEKRKRMTILGPYKAYKA